MKKSPAKTLKLTVRKETLLILEESALGLVDAAGTMRTACGSCATCIVLHTVCSP